MHDARTTAVAWTIWTIIEPANLIIAACLPTLRPIFVRIFPEKFFILTRKRDFSGNLKTAGSPNELAERKALFPLAEGKDDAEDQSCV